MSPSTFTEHFDRAKKRDSFWVESAILEFTEEVVVRMEHLGVSKTELAERLQRNPSFVTKLLRGDNNFTVATMVKLARQLDAELRIHLQPDGTVGEWLSFLKDEPARHAVPVPVRPAWGPETFQTVLEFDQPNEPLPTAA